MWTLTPDSLAQAREEIKGRRAALEARYAAELKNIDADLEEIETLERVAQSFRAKYLPGSTAVLSKPEEASWEPPAANVEEDAVASQLEPEPPQPMAGDPAPATTEESQIVAAAVAEPETAPRSAKAIAQLRSSPMEATLGSDTAPKGGSSRWRIRIPSENETA